MTNFIENYIFYNSKQKSKNISIKKEGNKYISKYLLPNNHYDSKAYHFYKEYKNDDDFIFGSIVITLFLEVLSGLLCMIPSIMGVIGFTLVNIMFICWLLYDCNKYESIVTITIHICGFLIALFILHFILYAELHGKSSTINDTVRYKAFHTLYPEYLFKFKF